MRNLESVRSGRFGLNKSDCNGHTLLHWAAASGDVQLCSELLAIPGVNVDAKSNKGVSPLSLAFGKGHKACCLQLIEAGASVNITAACHFAKSGYVMCLRAILKKNPEIIFHNSTTQNLTLLHAASAFGQAECVELLCNQPGIDVSARCARGHTALYYAIRGNNPECARILLEAGANVTELEALAKPQWLVEMALGVALAKIARMEKYFEEHPVSIQRKRHRRNLSEEAASMLCNLE
jgi:ankyrin repeat protein